jgi:hypothetical protein
MKKYFIVASILLLAASCSKQPGSVVTYPTPTPTAVATPSPTPTATSTILSLPLTYNNSDYGFKFSLPADWQGFTTLTQTWTGTPLQGSQYKATITGPEILIRNPNWTSANPYEDIPVMVFTPAEWTEIQKETLAVSAAPIPPSELGQNAKYVFALPARYDFDYKTGYQEVEQIMASNPLMGY